MEELIRLDFYPLIRVGDREEKILNDVIKKIKPENYDED